MSNAQTNRFYQKEPAIIQPGSRPVERLLYLEDHGVQYQCVQKCYPIVKPKPEPIPPPIVEPPAPAPPVRALIRPSIHPPIITIQPTKLPRVIPISYCQLMCLRYPYSIQCARCKRPMILEKTPVAPPVRVIHPPPVTTTTPPAPIEIPPPPKVIPIPPPRPVIPRTLPPPPAPPAPIRVQPPPQVIFNTMRCCYIDRCLVLPIQPVCPSVCYEPCDAICTGRCHTNPTCPNKCSEVAKQLREYKIKFMIWLHAKLDAIKLTHRQMVEQCILRTRAHYVSQIKSLQSQIKAAHPFLFTEPDNNSPEMRRSMQHGISINILGQQNIGGKGSTGGEQGGASPQFHVNQNIGISNNDPGSPEVGAGAPETSTKTPESEQEAPQQEQSGAVAVAG